LRKLLHAGRKPSVRKQNRSAKLKIGDKVEDRWFLYYGDGKVVKVMKTRIHVEFSCQGLVIYDMEHAKIFLRRKGK
jgi:hypothetical protein